MEKPTEQRADERGADSVQRPCPAINPEWTSLQNKPHLMPAICHPDAATIVRAAAKPRGNYDLGRKHAKGDFFRDSPNEKLRDGAPETPPLK